MSQRFGLLGRELEAFTDRPGGGEIEDEGEIYESIEDIWPDYPSKDDFFFNEDEY